MVVRWEPSYIHSTLCNIFGEQEVFEIAQAEEEPRRPRRVRPVVPPFIPPLTFREYETARKLYRSARAAPFWRPPPDSAPRDTRASAPDVEQRRWPVLKDGDFLADALIARLYVADSKAERRAADRAVAKLAQAMAMAGLRTDATLLRLARKNTPQGRSALSTRKFLLQFLPRLADLEFMWGFLKGEAAAYERTTQRNRRTAAAKYLAKDYAYLGLTRLQIEAGLQAKNWVETRLAADFPELSASSIRSVLSQRLKGVGWGEDEVKRLKLIK